MSNFVYVIGNYQNSKFTTYVGHTGNLKKRLNLHNKGKGAKFTRGRRWKVIYTEKYDTKKEAITREYYIKKNRKFRNLIKEAYKWKKK
jgi:putative endonuclease